MHVPQTLIAAVLLSLALHAAAAPPTITPEIARLIKQAHQLAATNAAAGVELIEHHAAPLRDPALLYTLGTLHMQLENYDQALSAFRSALAVHPEFDAALEQAGRIHLLLGQARPAIEACQTLVRRRSANETTYTLLGHALLLAGHTIGAEQAFRSALLLDPLNADAMNGLGHTLIAQKRMNETYELFDQLSRRFPLNPVYWRVKANAALARERTAETLSALETARQLGVLDHGMRILLARMYLLEGLTDAAWVHYESLAAAERPPVGQLIEAASVLVALQQPGRATELLDRVAAHNPDAGERYTMTRIRGDAAFQQTDYENALELYGRYLKDNPLDSDVLIRRGDALAELGRHEEALQHYERAQRQEGRAAIALTRQGRIEMERGRFPRALHLFEQAQALDEKQGLQSVISRLKEHLQGR